jgi:hypothetical protein
LGGISQSISYWKGQLNCLVAAGTALPTDVKNDLSLIGQLLHSDVGDEQSKHSFAIFGLS